MRPQLLYVFGVIVGLAVLGSLLLQDGDISGAATYSYEGEERDTYAYTLNDWVRGFFQAEGLAFPKGECMEVLRDLYKEVAFRQLTSTEDISTKGTQRVTNIMWGVEEYMVGALEMIKSKSMMKQEGGDSVIHLVSEVTTRVPKLSRTTVTEFNLVGTKRDWVYITHGSFTLPIFKCSFTTENGVATCDCARKTADYGASKIPGAPIINVK